MIDWAMTLLEEAMDLVNGVYAVKHGSFEARRRHLKREYGLLLKALAAPSPTPEGATDGATD